MADDVVQFGKAFQGERRVPGIADWPLPAVGGCASKKAADNHDDRIAAAQASEGDHLVAVRTGNGERMIGAMSKESGQLAAQLQQRPREETIGPSGEPVESVVPVENEADVPTLTDQGEESTHPQRRRGR